MKATGSIALRRVAGRPKWTSKCRCGPDELPEVLTRPMAAPPRHLLADDDVRAADQVAVPGGDVAFVVDLHVPAAAFDAG